MWDQQLRCGRAGPRVPPCTNAKCVTRGGGCRVKASALTQSVMVAAKQKNDVLIMGALLDCHLLVVVVAARVQATVVLFSVADLDAWIAKLRAEGVKFLDQPYRLGDTRAVMIEGPSAESIGWSR
jgi:hypothetical protein